MVYLVVEEAGSGLKPQAVLRQQDGKGPYLAVAEEVVEPGGFLADAASSKGLIAIAGIFHDVSDFVEGYPGGKVSIRSVIGKDSTAMFNSGVYNHSNAAHNILFAVRVVDVWRQTNPEKDVP
ncbi:putative stearoyl-CoA 9-desaturase [Microsporum canis]